MNTHDRPTIMHTTGRHKDIEVILLGALNCRHGVENVRSFSPFSLAALSFGVSRTTRTLAGVLTYKKRPDPRILPGGVGAGWRGQTCILVKCV